MPLAALTAEELELVEDFAREVRKDLALFFLETLKVAVDKMQSRVDDSDQQALIPSINAKLTDNAEEVLGVRVGTIKRLATDDLPTLEQLWAALKGVV